MSCEWQPKTQLDTATTGTTSDEASIRLTSYGMCWKMDMTDRGRIHIAHRGWLIWLNNVQTRSLIRSIGLEM